MNMTYASKRFFKLISVAILLAGATAAQPTIESVRDLASKVPPGFPFYSLAPGGFIEIHGSGLGPDTRVDDYPSFPLGQILAGSSVEITMGPMTVNALIASTSGREIKAIVPTGTPLGPGQVRVTYNGATSDPFDVVIGNSIGIFTQNGRGNGPALAINANFEPITIINPAHPGDIIMVLLSANGVAGASTPGDAPARPMRDLKQLQEKMKAGDPKAFARAAGVSSMGYAMQVGDGLQVPTLEYLSVAPGISGVVFQAPDVPGCWVPIHTIGASYNSSFATLSISAPQDKVCRDPGANYEDFLAMLQSFDKSGGFQASRSAQPRLVEFKFERKHVKPATASGGHLSVGAPQLDFMLSAKEKKLSDYVHLRGSSLGTQIFYTNPPKPLDSKHTPSYLDLGTSVQLIQEVTALLQKQPDGTYFHMQNFLSDLGQMLSLKYQVNNQPVTSAIDMMVPGIDHSPDVSSIDHPAMSVNGLHVSVLGPLPAGYFYLAKLITCLQNGYCSTISKVSTSSEIYFTPEELAYAVSTPSAQLIVSMKGKSNGTIEGFPTSDNVIPNMYSLGQLNITGIEFQNSQMQMNGY